ncbi:VWA domain-containing protein [Nitratiruptor sp. YY09-18]|uniref:VWA domain-containing protein n=1 Tax=Nitratiruptor sp. YY09-18 TaxID=2724901 RepID=UPI0019159714|nr:VWA domain-containing protein [Nitratiruptor sp. YY09-18]BCD68898.1 hypothetical protein NitYY0918_C1817 [Nitratiruptor sp. YY09-18]
MHVAFLYPPAFVLLVLLVCFVRCKREQLRIYFARTDLLPPSFIRRDLLPLFIAFLFVLALAGPIGYSSMGVSDHKGRDLVIAIDASGSMGGDFGKESKFDTLKKMVRAFLTHRYDDNVGIVAFGTFAYPAAPITFDLRALQFVLNYLDLSLAGNNTAIGDAIMQAVKMLKKSHAKKKAILLFTDGMQNSGRVSIKQAVAAAKKIGAKIYTVGIGDEYDAKLLERIAKESGGKSFSAKDPDALKEVLSDIDKLEASKLRSKNYIDMQPLFLGVIAFLALMLLYQIKRYL